MSFGYQQYGNPVEKEFFTTRPLHNCNKLSAPTKLLPGRISSQHTKVDTNKEHLLLVLMFQNDTVNIEYHKMLEYYRR